MKKIFYGLLASIVIIIFFATLTYSFFGVRPKTSSDLSEIMLPENFVIQVFAQGLGDNLVSYPGPNVGPRMMEFYHSALYASVPSQGKVIALPDADNNGTADGVITVIENLNKPHGLDFSDEWLYIAEESRVIRVKVDANHKANLETLEVIIDDLPTGGHFTRTIKIHNGSLYLSIGSSCNVCRESDERRAAVSQCDLDGKNCTVFAKGLRNSVGFVFHPLTNEMWATDNGRDQLGENLPPEEINFIQAGKDYGWPICYGNRIHDTDFDKNVYIRDPCQDTEPPVVEMQAHSAPLGLAFYYGDNFPEEYRGDLFVAFHGSWNRLEPTGYKIVRINIEEKTVQDFAKGWLQGNSVSGRPVDIVIADDGSMFVSDDNAGKIYRIYYSR